MNRQNYLHARQPSPAGDTLIRYRQIQPLPARSASGTKGAAMNRVRLAPIALGLAGLLTGCSGFWDKPTPPTPGNASGVFYVLNQSAEQVVGFSFASGSTTPTAVA